jgi:hypothetical protein
LITYPGKYASGWIPVRVTEYRNNQIVGYVQRELQYFGINRNKKNAVPTLSGVNGTTKYSIAFCVGSENCFTISSSDSNTTDSVFLISNNKLPGLSVSVDSKKAQGATICWTPDPKLITKSSYDITLRAFDNACPYNYYSDRNYTINLFQASAKPSYNVDSCGFVSFSTNLKVNRGDPKLIGIKWTGDDDFISDITNPNHHYSSSGKYFYSLTLFHKKTNCIIFKDSGFVNINRATSIELPNDTLACQGDTFFIKPNNVIGYGLIKYNWNTGDTTSTIRVPVMSTKKYTLTIKDKIGCIDSADFVLKMRDPIIIGKLVDSTVCPTYDTLKLTTTPSGGKWINSLIINDSLLIPSINDSNSILYVEYDYLDKYSCAVKKTFAVGVLPLKLANGGFDIDLCLNQENSYLQPVSKGIWQESPAINENTLLIKNLKLGDNAFFYYLENEFGCLSVDTVIATLHSPQKTLITNADSFCQNKTIEFSGIPESGKWILEGDTLKFRFFKPSINDSGWQNVIYIGKDANNCYDTSFKDIYIVPVPEVSISGLENDYCISNDSFLITGTPSGGIFTGNSIIEKNNKKFFVPEISGLGKTLIVYQVDNHNFCPSIDSVWIQVNNTPKADFEFTALNYTLPISVKFTDLSIGNPVKWSWNVENVDIDSSYLQDPVFSFNDSTSVFTSLTISDSNFCRDSIKKRINLSEFVGIDDLNHIHDIYIQIDYASKKLTIKNNLVLNNVSVISIFSFDGKLTNQFFVNQNTREINLNNLPSGFYFLHAQFDKLNKIFLITL